MNAPATVSGATPSGAAASGGQSRSIRIVVGPPTSARSVAVSWARWRPTVADLANGLGFEQSDLWINGDRCVASELLDGLNLFDGSIVGASPPSLNDGAIRLAAGPGSIVLDHVAGLRAGAQLRVDPGQYRAGRSDLPESAVATSAEVADETTIELMPPGDLSGHPSQPVGEGASIWAVDEIVRLGDDLFQTRSASAPGQRVERESSRRTHLVHRQPRVIPTYDNEIPTPKPAPALPADPAPLSWLMVLAPLPLGVFIAIVYRPGFLLFSLMGPVMALARWAEARRSFRKAVRTWEQTVTDQATHHRALVRRAVNEETHWRRNRQPTLGELRRRAQHSAPALWERRRTHDDFMTLTIGYHDEFWAADGDPQQLRSVPRTVTIEPGDVLGIVGDPLAAHAVGRSLLVQAATLHGPADLALAVVANDTSDWDWCAWLPHLVDPAALGDFAVQIRTDRDVCSPAQVAVCGSPEHHRRLVGQQRDESAVAAIVFAQRIEQLPATCGDVIVCVDGLVRHISVDDGAMVEAVVPTGCSTEFALDVALGLAPLTDADRSTVTSGLEIPDTVALVDLIGGFVDAGPAGDPRGNERPLSAESIVARWNNADGGIALRALVGSTGAPLEVDLVADGPHALIAGTTGSGKSELLRTLVASLACMYPPSQCSFVLIDFKGGGAFDPLAPLPHVAAVVTDLEAGLAERALTSLRAELHEREEILRHHGADSFASYQRCADRASARPALARLIIVVDEFATLASDLPDFLAGLVDIAQRGRSLGVHLVLATQRPAGVLDAKIRANTNLRICLRVQDAAESRDVVGVADAASLRTTVAGRAVVRVGVGNVAHVQCAHIGASAVTNVPGTLSIEPFELATVTPAARLRNADAASGPARTGAALGVVSFVVAAAETAGVERAAAPWLAPLPPVIDSNEFVAGSGGPDAGGIPLGVEDRPQVRSQPLWSWNPADGPLAVIGGGEEEREALAWTIAAMVDSDARACRSDRGSGEVKIHMVGSPSERAGAASPITDSAWIDRNDLEAIHRVLDNHAGVHQLIVFHNFERLGANLASGERTHLVERVTALVADADATARVVVMTATERGLPLRVLSGISQRLILRLADAGAYATFGIRQRESPLLAALEALDPATGNRVQLAQTRPPHRPHIGEVRRAPPVGGAVTLNDLHLGASPSDTASSDGAPRSGDADVGMVIGLDLATLEPASVDLSLGPFVVVGERQSGRTTALASFADAFRRVRPTENVVVISSNKREWPREFDRVVSPEELELAWAERAQSGAGIFDGEIGSPALVIVDDAGAVPSELGSTLIEQHLKGESFALVVAGLPEDFRAPTSWCRTLRGGRNGVILSSDRGHTDVLRVALSGYPGVVWRPGQGTVAQGETAFPVQIVDVFGG